MSTQNPQEILLDAAWAHSNAKDGESELDLMCQKMLNNRLDQALKNQIYWEGQAVACEKALTRLEKQIAKGGK